MKTKRNLIRITLLTAMLALANLATAQTFSIIHSFTNNPDGQGPRGLLTLSSNVLYGTTYEGGNQGVQGGTVYKVNTDGTGYVVLKNFGLDADSVYRENPIAGIILSDGVLYGTVASGAGSSGGGAVFRINTDGTGYTVLKSFSGSAGLNGLALSSNTLYGTTMNGGAGGGMVFKINTNGTGYSELIDFTGTDGWHPYAGLVFSGGVLYGTTQDGGSGGRGTVFKVNTDKTGFVVLKNFTNSPDGIYPKAGLVCSSNLLFGTTYSGGSGGYGTVFKVNTDGTDYSVLKNFNGSEGASPQGELTLSSNILYGTTGYGGSAGNGTVFKMNTNGSGYTVLKSFPVVVSNTNTDGANLQCGLILSGSVLFGTANKGGNAGRGTIFSLDTTIPGYNRIASQVLPGGKVRLDFLGNPGANYALDRSSTLTAASWSAQTTNLADGGGNLTFTNTPNAATANFWRVRSVP